MSLMDKEPKMKNIKRTLLKVVVLVLAVIMLASVVLPALLANAEEAKYFSEVFKANYDKKTKYKSWPAVAVDMGKCFSNAITAINEGKIREAYEHIDFAYFGFYEVQGFEATVLNYLSGKRVSHIEGQFREIKHALLGNIEFQPETIKRQIRELSVKVYKDALVLQQKAGKEDSDSLGEELFKHIPDPLLGVQAAGNEEIFKQAAELAKKADAAGLKELSASLTAQIPSELIENKADNKQPEAKAEAEKADSEKLEKQESEIKTEQAKPWYSMFVSADFNTAFWLLIREGLEAILVVAAIVAYLIKTNNKHFIKNIYMGCLLAIVSSVVLAYVIQHFISNAGVARELIEGWTMFLAVIVLFYVSNWILSKSEAVAWENYIGGMVRQSIDKNSKRALMFAAFLAVFREGAELILFYSASFSSGMNSPLNIGVGIALAVVALAVIWVIFRFTSVKLPLKPFFTFTSILLFLLCFSFMGKGVVELTEAGVITGGTVIPAMKGFSFEPLSIYDRAETLIPQIMVLVAAAAIMLSHALKTRKLKKEAANSAKVQTEPEALKQAKAGEKAETKIE